jgi:uncharacterized RDD family membrane protein YckC
MKASIAVRGVEAFIDFVVCYVILYVISAVTGNTIAGGGFYLTNGPILIGFGLCLAYFIIPEALMGATLGKLATNLRVVNEDGGPISWSQAIIRNLIRLIDGLVFYAIGFVAICVTAKRQRLGDLAAKTMVVQRAPKVAPNITTAAMVIALMFLASPLQAQQQSSDDAYNKGREFEKEQNYADAMHWYQVASDQGDTRAQVMIGDLHNEGHGVPEDPGEALRWYHMAADKGNVVAENNIGYFYLTGRGVPQDTGEALIWLQKASDQNYSQSEKTIAMIYFQGIGVPADRAEAIRWLHKAADDGDEESKTALKSLGE